MHRMAFFETSAKTGLNVAEAFTALSQTVYDKIQVGVASMTSFSFVAHRRGSIRPVS
jgi:GTPase SAR1 family protein